jgi:hypothetical protein
MRIGAAVRNGLRWLCPGTWSSWNYLWSREGPHFSWRPNHGVWREPLTTMTMTVMKS